MDLLKEFFSEAFPNPDRVDCPDEETLMALAEKRLPPAHPALLHLGSCSECYAEYRACCVELQEKINPTFDTPASDETPVVRSWSKTASGLCTDPKVSTRTVQRLRDWLLAAFHNLSRS
jgi:hypothetical protein